MKTISHRQGKLLHGDCVEVMKQIPSNCIPLVLTDPPYLVNYRDRSGRTIMNDKQNDWLEPAFKEIKRVMKPNSFCVSFYGFTKIDQFMKAWISCGLRPVGHLVFPKPYASKSGYMRYQHESAFLLVKGNPDFPKNPISDVLPWEYSGNKLHPTQKPLEALQPIIKSLSNQGDIVLDPFMGSGTTCFAAKQLKRRYVGIELDIQHYKTAENRLNI